jgi:hypothetical protein
MFRAKKKLASASLNTQAGRTAVIAFVGILACERITGSAGKWCK